jgi:hypothetical protein
MANDLIQPSSRLFTIRLWQEELGEGQCEWRGRAQDISTGNAAYFRDWQGLVSVLTRLVEAPGAPVDPQDEQATHTVAS